MSNVAEGPPATACALKGRDLQGESLLNMCWKNSALHENAPQEILRTLVWSCLARCLKAPHSIYALQRESSTKASCFTLQRPGTPTMHSHEMAIKHVMLSLSALKKNTIPLNNNGWATKNNPQTKKIAIYAYALQESLSSNELILTHGMLILSEDDMKLKHSTYFSRCSSACSNIFIFYIFLSIWQRKRNL